MIILLIVLEPLGSFEIISLNTGSRNICLHWGPYGNQNFIFQIRGPLHLEETRQKYACFHDLSNEEQIFRIYTKNEASIKDDNFQTFTDGHNVKD